MTGFSITLLKVDDETLALWTPQSTPGLITGVNKEKAMSLSRTQIVNWLTRCGDIFQHREQYLTGLDREIGDADHEAKYEPRL